MLVYFTPQVHAVARSFHGFKISEVSFATFFGVIVVQFLWNEVEIVCDVWETGANVIVKVGGTITNDNTFEIINCSVALLKHALNIVIVKLPSKIRYVNASIALT